MPSRIKNVGLSQEEAHERYITREWLGPPPAHRADAPPRGPDGITTCGNSSSSANTLANPLLGNWPDADFIRTWTYRTAHPHFYPPFMSLLKGREVELTQKQKAVIRFIECDTLECEICKCTSKDFRAFGWLFVKTWPSWGEDPGWGSTWPSFDVSQTVEDTSRPRAPTRTWTWIGWPRSAIMEVNYVCFACAQKRCREYSWSSLVGDDRRPTRSWFATNSRVFGSSHSPFRTSTFQTKKFQKVCTIRL